MSDHLNLKWTIADMDKLQRLALMRMPIQSIAKDMGADEKEIEQLMDRNGIRIAGDRQW